MVQAPSSPEHRVPVHPGADDDTDDEDADPAKKEIQKPSDEPVQEKQFAPIENLVDEPMEEG